MKYCGPVVASVASESRGQRRVPTARTAFGGAELLAVHAVALNLGGEYPPHRLLGVAVGDRHRRRIALALGRDRLAKMRPDRGARGIGEAMGQGDFGGKVHSGASIRSGWPAT